MSDYTKPDLPSFKKIHPLSIQQYERYIPTAFDNSLSLLEKINKVIEQTNIIGDIVNNATNSINEILSWVLNDGLYQEVTNKLNEMLNDGSFETIINHEILGSKSSIIVSTTQPTEVDTTTFWYHETDDFILE